METRFDMEREARYLARGEQTPGSPHGSCIQKPRVNGDVRRSFRAASLKDHVALISHWTFRLHLTLAVRDDENEDSSKCIEEASKTGVQTAWSFQGEPTSNFDRIASQPATTIPILNTSRDSFSRKITYSSVAFVPRQRKRIRRNSSSTLTALSGEYHQSTALGRFMPQG
jgi:hypothetical protein